MTVVLVILTVLSAAAGLAIVVAGVSLVVGTTRSPVARYILRTELGIESDDVHRDLGLLFETHAAKNPGDDTMTMARYRRSLRVAGVSSVLLGVGLLAFLGYAATLLFRYMG